jgi:hypothetical protein
MATTDELIAQLSLRATGLEIMNPLKSAAYAELKARGDSVVEPLIGALAGADTEAAPPILSLLGQAGDPRAIGPILGRLADPASKVRYEAVSALALFSASDLVVAGAPQALAARAEDSDRYVRDAATALALKLGALPSGSAWYAGAAGWEPLAKAFVARELTKPDPDYRSLAAHLAAYSSSERHAAWIDVAQEAPTRMGRTRAYLEALHNDPDPTSVAWGWLDGDFDLMGRVEQVIGSGDARTPATVEAQRERLGSIIDAGGADLPEAAAKAAVPQQKAVTPAALPTLSAAPEPVAADQVAAQPAAAQSVGAQPAAAQPAPAQPAAAQPAAAQPVGVQPAPAQPAAAQPAAAQPAVVQPAAAQPAAAQPVGARAAAAQITQPAAGSLTASAWSPTHFVPAGGLPAWDYPDPARPPRVALNVGLGLVIDSVAGDWALVRAVNGWRGWVDGRRLNRRA